MSSPVDGDFGYCRGASGVPTDDVSPYGGTIVGGTDYTSAETSLNVNLFGPLSLPTSGTVPYYGAGYRILNSTLPSSASTPKAYNRAGAITNILAGQPRIIATNSGDVGTLGNGPGVGLQVRLMAQVGSLWIPQWINLNGTSFSSDVAGGCLIVDAGTAYRWELVLNGLPTTIPSDVACFIGTQLCAVIRGTANPRRGIGGQGNNFCTAEVQFAVAVSKNSSVAGVNRLTAPAADLGSPASVAVGSFAPGVFFPGNTLWVGSDQSIVIPGGPLVPTDYWGYAVQFGAMNIPPPLGPFTADIGIICVPGN